MGVAVADGEQWSQDAVPIVETASVATDPAPRSDPTASLVIELAEPEARPDLSHADSVSDPSLTESPPLDDPASPPGDTAPGRSGDEPRFPADVAGPGPTPSRDATHSEPFSLEGLLLLDTEGSETVEIDTLSFSDEGIGVIRIRGEAARVLPWSSVITHAVEPWSGGVVPEWWVDPELERVAERDPGLASVIDPDATSRSLPHVEAGALIDIRTSTGTYRFLMPGGDAHTLSRQVTALAVKHQGPSGASSVTRVVAWGQDIERRRVTRKPKRAVSWSRVQPFLVVALVLFIAAAVTLILLQSAGTIHLPLLGGASSGTIGWLRIR